MIDPLVEKVYICNFFSYKLSKIDIFRVFLPELIKHENDPEDVGYCFIFSVEMLNTLYTEYCVNKEQNNYIIALPEAMQFFSVSEFSSFSNNILFSYLFCLMYQ